MHAASTSFEANYLPKLISCFISFLLNEHDLQILSSFFLIEMFDLRGNELKYAKELLLNLYRKSVQNSVRLKYMCRKS